MVTCGAQLGPCLRRLVSRVGFSSDPGVSIRGGVWAPSQPVGSGEGWQHLHLSSFCCSRCPHTSYLASAPCSGGHTISETCTDVLGTLGHLSWHKVDIFWCLNPALYQHNHESGK